MAVDISYIAPVKIPSNHTSIIQRARRYDNGFPQNMTIGQAVTYLEDEIQAINPERAVIYSNYERLNIERLRQKGPKEDSTVCVELGLRGKGYTIVCDTWYLAEHNLYALHLTLRAIRNMEKWGVAKMDDAMLCFNNTVRANAKPTDGGANEPDMARREWMSILGIGESATLDDANALYRQRAKTMAEDEDELLRLNKAIEAARDYFEHHG